LTGTRALLEKGKLVLELIAERTGDTYVYPTTKVSAPVADDNLDMEDFSS